ncbi:MAG: phosphate ABC transporter ATP-binding protein [Limnothrix sp. RL_2_0]|nr:phosphate ABC transporter ATP-binding protein [Limnothrix sp. RL_2_0]
MTTFHPKNTIHPTAIRTENLSLSYDQKIAFQDISLPIPAQKITAIVGPSGSGKSSFLTCLNRLTDLTQQCRVSGKVYLAGKNIFDPKIDVIALRRRVGMLFQQPNPFPFSIYKNLVFPLKEHGITDRSHVEYLIEESLTAVGLWDEVKDRLKSSALRLSGGQQQRLCLARTLVLKPEVILMDEPCSALDPISTGVIEDLIKDLGDRHTIVIVTHNLAQAKRISHQTALFWSQKNVGHLIEVAPTQDFFQHPVNPLTQAYVTGLKG